VKTTKYVPPIDDLPRGLANDNAHCGREGVTLNDFRAYMPMHSYIYTPCREMWPAASVNARVPPVPLIIDGAPVLDDKGKPIKQ
jgi:hypothetical protein